VLCGSICQQYGAIFDASIDVTPANQPKGRSLTFELSGEGNLPHIAVVRPTLRNKKGQQLLLFRRTLIGHSQTMPVVILNDGTLTCKVSGL
jgi:hydrocephalus-inducing protein